MKYAAVSWRVSDISELTGITDTEAEVWLERNAKYIADAMVQAGWDAIYDLLDQDGI